VDISNDEFGDNREPVIDRKEEQCSYWENLKLKGKTSKEESTLGSLFYRYFTFAEEEKISHVAFTLNSHYFRYDPNIVVMNFLTSSLEYLLRHYFTSITEIAMITKNDEIKNLIENYLEELRKFIS
jgi:hypothetical protein